MSVDTYHHVTKPAEPGAPLVFTFHGTGGDEHQFTGLIEQILPRAGIVAPRGDVSEHGANRYFRRTAEGVYDMEDLAARKQKMTAFITAHRDANPGAPVYALGYSNGANILAAVLFDAPGLVERAVLMHPLIPWQPARNPGLAGARFLITAGRHDRICPLPMTEALIDTLRQQGAQVTVEMHDGGHEVRQSETDAIRAFLTRREAVTQRG